MCFIAAVLIYYIISVQIHAKDENYKPGISIYTIVSPSMTPNINVYDVVFVVKTNTDKIDNNIFFIISCARLYSIEHWFKCYKGLKWVYVTF